ncbi:MAG TPA: NUDIX hydrolase [Planctomycetota bacterium]|nr:NUDIX hydrolase [Planctomycetota bacterium]
MDLAALVSAENPALARDESLASARALLEAYLPRDERQARFRREMLAFLDEHPLDAHRRSCVPGHLTASALVIDAVGERALLTHHKKLGRWLQLGGHCDGDSNLAAVALREAWEESGISGLVIDPRAIDLDIHVIPARAGEPEHLHLDTRFLVHAPTGAREAASEESHRLAWIAKSDLANLGTDESVRRLFELAF